LRILAYCLMPTHFHLVLQPDDDRRVSLFLHWLLTSHVRRHHQRYGSSGHIWQGRFKSFLIAEDDHLLTVLRYVEANPVRAGLARTAADWTWSSYRARLARTYGGLLDLAPVPEPADWAAFVASDLSESELDRIQTSVRRQSPYGPELWMQQIARNLELESTLRPRGRPRKTPRPSGEK